MPHIPSEQLNKFLSSIPDAKQRKLLADIATGKVVQEVHCMSDDISHEIHSISEENGEEIVETILDREGCKGRLIAYIYSEGRVGETVDENGNMYLRSSRLRLDGHRGFECWCGNDSRLAKQEMADISTNGAPPTQEGIGNIIKNLQTDPPNYPVIDGIQEVDGFIIKNIT